MDEKREKMAKVTHYASENESETIRKLFWCPAHSVENFQNYYYLFASDLPVVCKWFKKLQRIEKSALYRLEIALNFRLKLTFWATNRFKVAPFYSIFFKSLIFFHTKNNLKFSSELSDDLTFKIKTSMNCDKF